MVTLTNRWLRNWLKMQNHLNNLINWISLWNCIKVMVNKNDYFHTNGFIILDALPLNFIGLSIICVGDIFLHIPSI